MRQCIAKQRVGFVLLAVCVSALSGCTVDPSGTGAARRGQFAFGGQTTTGAASLTEAAFEPVRLRVHPLTHLDFEGGNDSKQGDSKPDGAGTRGATLALHYELRDQFTDPVKGLGVLRVEATRRGVGSATGSTLETATWDVADLADPTINSRRFDPATRTYRVTLTAPEWMKTWANAQASGAAEGRGSVVLKVTLATPRSDGTRRMLMDEFVMER